MEKLIADISEHEIRENGFSPRELAAKADGVMLRLGWAGYNGELELDDDIAELIEASKAAGMHIGLYLYCYCKSPFAANLAANKAIRFAERYTGKIDLPIALMVSESRLPCLIGQGKEGLTDTVIAFLFEVERLGWQSMFATYTDFALIHLDMNRLKSRELWITDFLEKQEEISRLPEWDNCGIRRCFPNMSRCFKDYPKIIAEQGKNGFSSAFGKD